LKKEGSCYLENIGRKFKKYLIVIQGKEIYFYRKNIASPPKFMHSLIGTFIKVAPTVQTNKYSLWPLKLVLPGNKTRYMYFQS
jgi:hypothetical protein